MNYKKRKTTVARKLNPNAMATRLSCFQSIAMFLEYIDDRSSEVKSTIIAITASHRPMSVIDKGKSILYPSKMW